MGNQPAGKNSNATAYNLFQLRVQLHVEAYRSLGSAISQAQKSLFQRFEKQAGSDLKYLENGNVSFGVAADREYLLQSDALMEAPAEEEPTRRPFQISDFEAVGIFVPQLILDELGPLFSKPANFDPDADPDSQ